MGVLFAVGLPLILQTTLDLASVACSGDSCYSTSGIGEDCLASITTGIKDEYDLGFTPPTIIAESEFTSLSCGE